DDLFGLPIVHMDNGYELAIVTFQRFPSIYPQERAHADADDGIRSTTLVENLECIRRWTDVADWRAERCGQIEPGGKVTELSKVVPLAVPLGITTEHERVGRAERGTVLERNRHVIEIHVRQQVIA